MQNQQELSTVFYGNMVPEVLAKISGKNVPNLLNIDGWNIKAIFDNKPDSIAVVYCYEDLFSDLLWSSESEFNKNTFIITKEALTSEDTEQALSLGISCYTLDNVHELLKNLLEIAIEYPFEQFLQDTQQIPKAEVRKEKVSCLPTLDGAILQQATRIAISKWVGHALLNRRKDAETRFASLLRATDDNCHALLAEALLGKGDYGINSLKYFLLLEFGMPPAQNDFHSQQKIGKWISALEKDLCGERQYIKVRVKNENQEKIIRFLHITEKRVSDAYDRYMPSKPKRVITDQNYRTVFKDFIQDSSPFAEYMIANVFELSRKDAERIRKPLYNHLLKGDSLTTCELHVLSPDYWKAVCAEIDAVCPENHQQSWDKIKSDMYKIFNDPDTPWLYFPENRVCKPLKFICNSLLGKPDINISKALYLLSVLDRKSITLDSQSLKNMDSIKTLYVKFLMNKFVSCAKQLEFLDSSLTDEVISDIQFIGAASVKIFQEVFVKGNHEQLRLFLDCNSQSSFDWQNMCFTAIANGYTKIVQLLVADNKLKGEYNYNKEYMLQAYNCKNSLSIVRILCPLQQSWSKFIEESWNQNYMISADRYSRIFMMLTVTSLGVSTCFNDLRYHPPVKHCIDVLEKMIDKAKTTPSLLQVQKFMLFASVDPLPKDILSIILKTMMHTQSGLDFTDEQIESLVPKK